MKPKVKYRQDPNNQIAVGFPALLYAGTVDHPKLSNSSIVLTSVVLSIGPDGEFETLNTRYVREV